MTGGRSRTATVAALQALALIALLLALAGVGGLDDRARPGVLVLVDRSLSVPRPNADAALAALRRAEPGARVEAIEFAGRPARVASLRSGARDEADGREPSNDIEPSATNLERAVDAALAASAQRPYASLVIVSDGRANAGDAARALASARDAGLPVLWLTAARSAPRAWIADMQAPTRARRGQAIPIVVPVAGDMTAPLRITATLRDAAGAERTVSATPDALGLATLRTTADRSGPLRISLSLMDADSGKVLDARRDAAVVDVLEPARLLYLRGSPGPLAVSLATGGWDLETAPARRAEDFRERLGGYEAVVLDDVSREDAGDGFWQALAGEVRTRGLGLLVLGGERAFARGGYRDSPLESVLPVLSEPASLDPPASVVFAVDKSGSMGEGSRGVDRLSLAERAVLEALGTLGPRDSAGVVAFDVEPRVLQPLQPAAAVARALAGRWPIEARGGTRLAPAIELAAGQLEKAGPGRRILIVVTDGFVDEAPLEALRRRLEASRIETVALAVGPDADATALERLTGRGGGVVLRVGEAAQLPGAMRAGLERRRARVERGVIEVQRGRAAGVARVARRALATDRSLCGDAPAAGGDGMAAVRAGRHRDRRLAGRRGPGGRRHQRPRRVDAALAAVGGVAAARRRTRRLGRRRTRRGCVRAAGERPARWTARRARRAARRALERVGADHADRDHADGPHPDARAAAARAGPPAGHARGDGARALCAGRLGCARRTAHAAPARQPRGGGRLG